MTGQTSQRKKISTSVSLILYLLMHTDHLIVRFWPVYQNKVGNRDTQHYTETRLSGEPEEDSAKIIMTQ